MKMELKKILVGLEGLKVKGNLDLDIKGIEKNIEYNYNLADLLKSAKSAINENDKEKVAGIIKSINDFNKIKKKIEKKGKISY